ncbi:transmembrane protein 131-like isoform X3 [Mytilus californianus]|uniref:transmembrane protein 131-like isoform X3 n=1 Tax=Mytilus californianus TaxID=6549 RepID=UPI0022462B8A|nr:transmembrane protein 131-like isoform X3 [Mytilus californianus]
MARGTCHNREKMSKEWFHFVILLHTFLQNFSLISAIESHSQAFIQTDNHLTYIGDGRDFNGIPVEVIPGEPINLISRIEQENKDIFKSNTVKFEPSWLDFQQQPVGMPIMQQVLVQNTDTKNSLHLLSISGSTVHFHCSFFQEKMVPPGGNTTFDVVFLARQEGNVENTLYIHTSHGSFTFHVFGVGIPNPYRLRPYLGAKVPLNSSYSPLIKIHNPHGSTLQILEMFASEGDLHLELPTGDLEAPKNLWEIPPYETKAVMKANFVGRVVNNHTAFIRIKTNQEQKSHLLILPVEVEVSSSPGIYSPSEMIDFGIMRTLDDPATVQLKLMNTGSKPMHIVSVSVSPPNDAINIEFRPTKLQPDIVRHTTIAHVTFKASKALHPKQMLGKIIVKSKNGEQKIIIPYQATVYHGSLAYNANNTHFFSARDKWNYTRFMTFTNTFNFTVVIYNVSIPSLVKQYFSILNFTKPVSIESRQTLTAFLLKFHPNDTQLHFTTYLTLYTNASQFVIPIVVYNGLLQVIPHRPEKYKGQFDFGTMGMSETRCMTFTLRNDNPVDVHIGEITPDMNGTTVTFLGMEKGNGTMLTKEHNTSDVDYNWLKISPYHFAVFSVNLTAPDYEGIFASDMLITTQFEDIWIPVTLRTSDGSLNTIPEKLIFERVFPGKVPYKVLQIYSSFRDFMEVTSVSFQPSDTRFYFEPPNNERILLEPFKNNIVGNIYFDSKRECKEDCYVGLQTNTPAGQQWLSGLGLDKEVADTDQYLFTRLQQKWDKLEKSEQNTANVTIEIDTSEVRGFLFSAQSHLHWPSLFRKHKIKFPLTQIGNTSVSDFIVENPGNVPVLIQILPLSLYPNPQTIIELLSQRLTSDISDMIETDDLDIFTLPDLEQYNPNPQNPVPGFRKHIESTLGVKPHKHSITTVLQPGVKVKVRVGFQPRDDISRTSLILIRNNLTIIDAIVVQGQGGRGEMKLSNKKPGSGIPLQFDMTEKHLKNCDRKKQTKNTIPNFTVRRSFTLKNTGELPFYVHGYAINNSPCEGYGYKVLDCDGFELLPNSSKKIDIAFTPDFTMSRIRRSLTVFTSLGGSANYTLQATVPPHTLSKCSAALPRPNWEPVLYYSITCVMGFLLFCILVAAYFEADRIFVADIIRRKVKNSTLNQNPYDKSKVFDLKQVAGLHHNNNTPVQPKKVLIPTKPPDITLPIKEISNGHTNRFTEEKQQLTEEKSFFTTFLAVAKKFFAPKPSNRGRPKINRQNSRDKDVENKTTRVIDRSKPVEPPISEKSIEQQKSKRTKAAKRQSSAEEVQLTHDRKVSKELNHVDKKVSSKLNNHDSKNNIKTKPVTMTTDVETTEKLRQQSSYEGKSKKKQKNNNNKTDLSLHIPVFVSRISQEDDTSSTTTESSNGDGDEKSSSARESTPEPPPPQPTKSKKKSKTPVHSHGHVDDDDEDFEVTSKSKAYNRIKSSTKDATCNGGNILQPRTYELDYNPDAKQEKNNTQDMTNKSKKSTKNKNNKKKEESFENVDKLDGVNKWQQDSSSGSEREDTQPVWDMPNHESPGDLSELSIQTSNFEQKFNKTVTGSFSPETLTSSSRSSSYSSIVSNSSNENQKAKNDKRFTSPFPTYSEAPGTIGSKCKTPPVGSGKVRSVWSNTPPATPDPIGNSFGLQTIQESRPVPTQENDPFNTPDPPFESVYAFGNDTPFESQQQPALTMMQRLQMDRRKKIQEHQMRVMKGTTKQNDLIFAFRARQLSVGEDWPGFDVPAVRSESLWDSEYNPVGNRWPSPDTSPTGGNSLWSTLTNSANSGWNSLVSLTSSWGSNTPATNLSEAEGGIYPDASGSTQAPNIGGSPESVGSFSPFNNMSNIWGPNAPISSSGWNMPTNTDTTDSK